jgi:hypothetical protein
MVGGQVRGLELIAETLRKISPRTAKTEFRLSQARNRGAIIVEASRFGRTLKTEVDENLFDKVGELKNIAKAAAKLAERLHPLAGQAALRFRLRAKHMGIQVQLPRRSI